MRELPPEIIAFLQEHHVLVLATSIDDIPYTASVFYVFDPEGGDLIFLSDRATRHGYESLVNDRVAAAIHVETREVSEIKGAQITGVVGELDETESDYERLREMYLDAFPVARGRETTFWRLRAGYIKMTDNSIRFGHKQIWERGD